MSIKEYIDAKRKIQNALLDFIEDEDEVKSEDIYRQLKEFLTDPKIKDDLKSLILLISNISDNHHRNDKFILKIGEIIRLIKNEIQRNFTNLEIFNFFKNNKRVLLLLIQENIMTIDTKVAREMELKEYREYFLPEIQCNDATDEFNEKQNQGENDSYICKLIRADLVEEFIVYINKNNISINSCVNHSIFETNKFLIDKTPSLIEYSAFYGSIQIFQYLQINKAELPPTLWLYAIHSKSGIMIKNIEALSIKPSDQTFKECLAESIKCHHNDISAYIKDSLLSNDKQFNQTVVSNSIIEYHNYSFFPNDNEEEVEEFCFRKLVYLVLIQSNKIQLGYSALFQLLIGKDKFKAFFINIDDYKICKETGESFYKSYIVEGNDGKQYFMRKVTNSSKLKEYLKSFDINYPSILRIKGLSWIDFKHEENPIFLFDYYPLTLPKYIRNHKINDQTKDYIIILGIAIAMKHLHDNGIAHESFCPRSILLDENFYPIVCDLGFSKDSTYPLNVPQEYELVKIASYMPPEYFEESRFDPSSNVYSYSLILFNIISKEEPFSSLFQKRSPSFFQIAQKIVNCIRPDISQIDHHFDYHSDLIHELIRNCWHQNPEERLTADQVLECITSEDFYSSFYELDHKLVLEYLEIYGNEFNELKNKFI